MHRTEPSGWQPRQVIGPFHPRVSQTLASLSLYYYGPRGRGNVATQASSSACSGSFVLGLVVSRKTKASRQRGEGGRSALIPSTEATVSTAPKSLTVLYWRTPLSKNEKRHDLSQLPHWQWCLRRR